jgi:single-strand DNA-binding protein
MLNKIMLMGRLTKDPELRRTNTNSIPVAGFALAVDRRLVKGKEKVTDFFNIVAWQATAEFVKRNFTKGQPMCVEGRLQQRQWTDEKGNTRYAYEIIAESVHFAGFKKQDSQNAGNVIDFDPYAEQTAAYTEPVPAAA